MFERTSQETSPPTKLRREISSKASFNKNSSKSLNKISSKKTPETSPPKIQEKFPPHTIYKEQFSARKYLKETYTKKYLKRIIDQKIPQ